MREVSCRALDPFFAAADRRRIPRAQLAIETGKDLAFLESRHERVDWEVFRKFMANVRHHFTETDLVEIGAVGLKQAGFRSFALIGRTLFSASGFYRWMLTSGGMGNQLFSNMSPSYRELADGRLDLDLQVAFGYEPCPDFFHFARGGFQALPQLMGLSEARVNMVWIERGARFEIQYDARASRRARLLRRLTSGKDARATAKDLGETITVLERRNVELEGVRAEVERQRDLLDLAYRLGQRIAGKRDVSVIAAAATEGIVGHATVRGVRFRTTAPVAGLWSHAATDSAPTVSVDLPKYGDLAVWADTAADARALVELVAPTITLALDNATAYHELAAYQAGLEALVEQRTTELRSAVDQLREAQSARQKFFANISHEIRTPLSLIVLAADDVDRRAGALLDARAKQSLGSITEGARKLLRLVDELLLLAAGQENKLVLRPEPTDLAALISHMFAAWRPAAEGAKLALELRVPESMIAMVDPVALERVASNLVSNAIKYTPAGGRVEVELANEPTGLRLSVFDDGNGIDADLAARLFGRFERSANTSSQTIGTGIGLALVKQLVEAHGGTVDAFPRVGPGTRGTEMRVVLPLTLLTTAENVVTRPQLLIESAMAELVHSGMVLVPQELSAGTILIAEDDPKLAHQISQLLASTYTVVVALDGEAALGLVKQHQPQLLITDVDMPKMNGIELARRFRETTGDSLAPIIILSAVMDLGTRVAGLDAGAVDYVGKPFDPRELEARVRSQFRMRDLAVRLHRAEQLASLGILTSGLAHELRNPANGIVNAIEPILEMLPANVPKGVTALMEVMKECAEQIGFLSRQLLGFRGTEALEMRSAQIPELIQRAVSLAHNSLNNVDMRTDLDLERSVMCAPPLLVQVLTNLIENAGQAAGRGGWVEVRGARHAGRIVVEVLDSGPGVPLPLRERIFEPFFTTKPQGVGQGLGLSVARAIVQRHGGILEVRERGQRTAFVIELPDSKAA